MDEGLAFANENEAEYFEVSAKENVNVDRVFESVA